jgi:hypothetical protein
MNNPYSKPLLSTTILSFLTALFLLSSCKDKKEIPAPKVCQAIEASTKWQGLDVDFSFTYQQQGLLSELALTSFQYPVASYHFSYNKEGQIQKIELEESDAGLTELIEFSWQGEKLIEYVITTYQDDKEFKEINILKYTNGTSLPTTVEKYTEDRIKYEYTDLSYDKHGNIAELNTFAPDSVGNFTLRNRDIYEYDQREYNQAFRNIKYDFLTNYVLAFIAPTKNYLIKFTTKRDIGRDWEETFETSFTYLTDENGNITELNQEDAKIEITYSCED